MGSGKPGLPLTATPSLRPTRLEQAGLAALALLTVGLELPLRGWWVEDAAIAFSYARNVALGEGLVPFPGYERVEGYSDALWVALLALGHLVGLDPFFFAKVLGGLFAAACVPLAWAITARIPMPDRYPRLVRVAPMIAAAAVATNAQHVIWAAAGLENSLFSFLLALGIWRVLIESERGGMTWASLAFFGLAITRPEGVVYAAFCLAIGSWADLRNGRAKRILASFATFAVPFLAYHAARYAYFAYPYPMTYYTKVEAMSFRLFSWEARTWKYPRRWASLTGWGWLLPVLFASLAGTRGWRGVVASLWGAGFIAAIFFATPAYNELRIEFLIASMAVIPALALGRAGWAGRALCAGTSVAAIAFVVRAGGDWMSGYRFMSFLVVPLGVLYALGLAELGSRLPKVPSALLVGVGALVPAIFNIVFVVDYYDHPEQTPQSVGQRVDHYNRVCDRIHLHRPWVAVDHSMGGMTWWGPPHGKSIDPFGLTDIPFALHREVKTFRKPYILTPPLFDFGFVKAGSGTLLEEPVFRDRFVRLPPYKSGKRVDPNTWINRRLLASPTWTGTPARVTTQDGPTIEGFDVRSPEVSVRGGLYVEIGLKGAPSKAPFKLTVFLSGPKTAQFPASVGYDKIFPVSGWRDDEVFDGRYAFDLPKDLPPGTYDLGFVLAWADGTPLIPTAAPEGALLAGDAPVVSPGEVRFPARVTVVKGEKAKVYAEDDWSRALELAASGDCDAADDAWLDAIEHLPTDEAWEDTLTARAKAPLSECWSRRVPTEDNLDAKLDDLARARRWDAVSPSAFAAGQTVADETWDEAAAARDAGDLPRTLKLFESIVTADPTRAWARRYAEDARAAILADGQVPPGLNEETDEPDGR